MALSSNSKLRRGAATAKMGILRRISAAFGHHFHSLQDSFRRLAKDPLQTLMTASVITIALSLPASLFLAVDNARQFENSFESFSQITVYVANNVSKKKISSIESQLQEMSEVASVIYISPEQALQEFTQNSGFGSALKYLESNPLPPVFIIEPMDDFALEATKVLPLLAKISQIAEVEDTQIDMLWLQRLRSLTQIGQKIVFALGFVLALGVLVIVGNSIRLTIHGRREEIIVVKLVGGTDAYVRRPFLYSGMLMGLIGAMGAALIIVVGFWWLGGSVAQLSELYNSQFRLHSLGAQGCLVLIAVGASLGLSGSWLAVTRHLKNIKPR